MRSAADATASGSGKVEKLDQAGEFRRHLDRGRGEDQRSGGWRRISVPHRAAGARPPGYPDDDGNLSERTPLRASWSPDSRAPGRDRSCCRSRSWIRFRRIGIGGVTGRVDASLKIDERAAPPNSMPDRTSPSAIVHSKSARFKFGTGGSEPASWRALPRPSP